MERRNPSRYAAMAVVALAVLIARGCDSGRDRGRGQGGREDDAGAEVVVPAEVARKATAAKPIGPSSLLD